MDAEDNSPPSHTRVLGHPTHRQPLAWLGCAQIMALMGGQVSSVTVALITPSLL